MDRSLRRAERPPLPLRSDEAAPFAFRDRFIRHFARLAGWRRQLLTAFGLGLLAALALPPVHAIPVLLLSFPGLLILRGRAELEARGAGWASPGAAMSPASTG